MAATEDQHNISCISDPNFAVVCSFFEKFSSLCGIKQHTHKELQEMIDFVDEIPPELIDLHIRLMRKARKNVNPDRWERTLAKFCYFSLPDDCFLLEQNGYKELDCSQRLRILVALIGSQFDYNVKFKTDINKLGIDDLRLSPFGRDKHGNNFWLHTDEDLNLKIYKENSEDEKWELLATNREGVQELIEVLMKERDPNRKLEEIENEEEELDEEEEEEEEEELETLNASDEKPELEQQPVTEPALEKEPSPEPQPAINAEVKAVVEVKPVKSPTPPVEPSQQESKCTQPTQKSIEPVAQKPPSQNDKNELIETLKIEKSKPSQPAELTPIRIPFELQKKVKFADPPVKPLNKESFAQHIKTLHSHDVLRPLLYDSELKVTSNTGDSLKSKINQKFNAIKPTISSNRDLLIVKTAKPGLKLEQILKSKLAQKLAANSPAMSETKETTATDVPSASSSKDATSIELPSGNAESAVEITSTAATINAAPLKRKLSVEEGIDVKKTKLGEGDDEDDEIEEPVMLVTGVGSGKACDTGNETDTEKKAESAQLSNAATNQLTHKVDDILKKADSENGESASISDETSHLPAAKSEAEVAGEKKKPKLWTIDAICSSDSKETKRSDDVSSFPNYSFNRDSKKSENSLFRSSGSGESYSIFNLAADSKEDHSMSMPTNFYFGCNNQNPCFLPSERSPVNNYKQPNKTHNVKDFVDDLEAKESSHSGAGEVPKFNVESLCSKAPAFVNDAPVEESVVESGRGLISGNETEKVLNFGREFSTASNNEALPLPVPDVSQFAPTENVRQASETEADEKLRCESVAESSHADSKPVDDAHSEASHKINPTAETANPPSTVGEPEPAIDTGAASFKPVDIVAQEMTSVSADVTNQNVEPLPEYQNSCVTSVPIADTVRDVTGGESRKTIHTNAGSCFSDKHVAVEPQIEAVNEETNEKTDVDDVNTKLDAVKSPHPVQSGEVKPAPSKVLDEPVRESAKSPSPTSVEVDESKSTDNAVTDKKEAFTPPASPPVSPKVPHFDSECVAEQNSSLPVDEPSISDESQEPVEKLVRSSSVKSAIEAAESSKDSSTAVFLTETKHQPEAAAKTELRSSSEKLLPTQETIATEPVDRVKSRVESNVESPCEADAEVKSKDFVPSEEVEQKHVLKDKNIELPAGQPSKSNLTNPADDVVTSAASDAPVKTLLKVEAADEKGVEAPSICGDNRRTKQSKDETDTKSGRQGGKRKKLDVEPIHTDSDSVDKADVEKPKNSTENEPSTENAEIATEAKKSESDVNTSLDQPSESTDKDETVESARDQIQEEVEEKSAAGLSQKESEPTDSNESKPETNGSQPSTSDDSKEPVIAPPTSGRRKSRRTEASRLREENGSANEESTESTVPKRATRRSQVGGDGEEEPSKAKPTKPVKSKPATPAVESKRGRKGQSATEKSAVKEPAGKKGKAKASSDETKRAESSKKGQTSEETDDKETPKKKRGRAKKLSKEIIDDVESDDEKEGDSEAKSNDEDAEEQSEATVDENDKSEVSVKKSEKVIPKKRVTKRGWINEVDIKNIEKPNKDGSPGIRQSRRIAQLKIKEQAEVKYVEPVTTPKKASANQKSKPVSSVKKNNSKSPNKKNKNKSNRDESEDEMPEKIDPSPKKKKKKTDLKKNFDVNKAWKASSDSSSEEEEADEEDHFEEDEEEIVINDASDHEFSPESDIDDDDYRPVKRARTAHSKPSAEDEIERDDLNCQSCGTADDPDWILLCDVCDEGWHASCLKPPILSIPEGDWFCPPCQHNKLITNLQKFLITYDKNKKKKANEELRKKRLEYVDISFSNIIIDSQASQKVMPKASRTESDSSGSSDGSSSEESEEEPLYQLRVRRQVNVSHRLNEYEELMNSAIQREDNIQEVDTGPVPEPEVTEAPIIPNGDEHAPPEQEVAEAEDDNDDNEAEGENDEESEEDVAEEKKVAPVILNLRNIRKRPPPLTKLDVSSDDDRYSDEDFKGSSADDRDEDDDYGKSETDSDEAQYRRGRHGPVRRSTRARVARYDKDFIDDNSDDDDDEEYGGKKKKKKKRKHYSESESEEEDETWGSRKKKKSARPPPRSSRSSHKKRKRIRFEGDSDEDQKKPAKSRVKYGLDESDDDHPQRRTRGKKINYEEDVGSDSEEEEDYSQKKKAKKVVSDDDEYMEDDDNGNDPSAKRGLKSGSEEDDESKSDENDSTADPDEPASSADSTKAVSPTQPVAEPKAVAAEKTTPQITDTASPKKTDKTEVHEKIPVAEEATTKPSMPVESAKIMNQTPAPMQQPYGDILKEDPKAAPTIVDANSSLKGMQSMAQSLGQMNAAVAAAAYPAPSAVDPKYPPISTASGPVPVNFADVGIRYEDTDGEKFAPPIRVISPSKLYAMQEQKRPPLPPQFAAPPHIPPNMPRMPPSRMMIPHAMPNAMRMPSTVPMGANPQMRHPLPGALQPPQPGMGMPANAPSPKAKPARKSRSKKQQEQERLEREAMEAAGRGGDEGMPLHMLKGPAPPPSEMNILRQPPPHLAMPPFSTASAPPFMPYPNVQPQMRFPPHPSAQPPSAGPPATAPAAGSQSKRVKHTPMRMNMPAPQNMMRFQRPPGAAPVYRPQAADAPASGASQVAHNDKGSMAPASGGAPAVATSPGKSEPTSIAPPIMKPEQYYQPMSTYPPSQMPRGQHRPEFTFVRNPMPPSGYRQPPPGGPPTLTVTSSYGRMPHPYAVPSASPSGAQPHPPVAGPPMNHSAPAKPDAAAKAPPSTVPAGTPPHSYPSPYLPAPPGAPTASSPKMTPAHPPPTSTSPYQMHMKQLPLTVAATMQSSTAPNLIYGPPPMYYTSPMMPTQYGHPPPAQLPPGAPQPYPSAPVTQGPPTSSAGVRPAPIPTSMPYQPPLTQSSADLPPTSMQSEYAPPTSQPGEFHYAPESAPMPPQPAVSSAPATTDSDTSAYSHQPTSSYDKEAEERQQSVEQQPKTPTEESSGEFGGLVSYFSSQREDDLDS